MKPIGSERPYLLIWTFPNTPLLSCFPCFLRYKRESGHGLGKRRAQARPVPSEDEGGLIKREYMEEPIVAGLTHEEGTTRWARRRAAHGARAPWKNWEISVNCRVDVPGLGHGPQEIAGVDEAHSVPGPDVGVGNSATALTRSWQDLVVNPVVRGQV